MERKPRKATKYDAHIYLWTSSHGCDHRWLPDEMDEVFAYSDFDNPDIPQSPEIIAKSGLKISHDLVHLITNKAISTFPRPQIHFVLLGDNNLRPNRDGAEECVDTLKYFEQLVKNFSNFSNCRLVICSIIPCPLTDYRSRQKFQEMNQLLKNLAETEESRVTFLNFNKYFLFEGNIRTIVEVEGRQGYLFNRDGIHLSRLGARLLSLRLLEFLRLLPLRFH